MGVLPARSAASFASSTSTQVTACPESAKQVPATSPTYPVPTTAMRMRPRTLVGERPRRKMRAEKASPVAQAVDEGGLARELLETGDRLQPQVVARHRPAHRRPRA